MLCMWMSELALCPSSRLVSVSDRTIFVSALYTVSRSLSCVIGCLWGSHNPATHPAARMQFLSMS